jgi:hypothetical protein
MTQPFQLSLRKSAPKIATAAMTGFQSPPARAFLISIV